MTELPSFIEGVASNMKDNEIKELKNLENFDARILNVFSKYERCLTDSVVIRTMTEYEFWLGIYSCDKSKFSNSIEAFAHLWLTFLIDCEEWHNYYQSNDEFAEAIYKNFFLKYLSELRPTAMDKDFAESYINNAILNKTKLIEANRKRYPVEKYNLIYPDTGTPGIYLNLKIVDEKQFRYSISPISEALELKYDNTWAGYRDIFIETKEKYLFFCE